MLLADFANLSTQENVRFPKPLADILDKVTSRRVDVTDLHNPVYKLRYDAYRRENFIPVNSEEICVDDLDDTPNAMCFGIYIDDELVSSLRVHHLTPQCRKSPSMKVYPDILSPMLDEGLTFIDPSRFTVDKEASLAIPALPFLTLRIGTMAAVYFDVDYSLSIVRPEHSPFYRRVFLSKEMAGVREYPDLAFPVCLYGTHLPSVRAAVGDRFPIFKSTAEERELLFGPKKKGEDFPFVPLSAVEADNMDSNSPLPV